LAASEKSMAKGAKHLAALANELAATCS